MNRSYTWFAPLLAVGWVIMLIPSLIISIVTSADRTGIGLEFVYYRGHVPLVRPIV
jgi:hypothetical protein